MKKEFINWIHDNIIWFENWSWELIWEIEWFLENLYIFEMILKENLNDIWNDK